MSSLSFSAEKINGLHLPMALVGPGADRAQLRVTELRRSDTFYRGKFTIWSPLLDYIDADLHAQRPLFDATLVALNRRVRHDRDDDDKTAMGFNARQRIVKRLASDGLVDAKVKTGIIEELYVATSEADTDLELPELRDIATALAGLRRHYVLLGTMRLGSRIADIAGLIEVEQAYEARPQSNGYGRNRTDFRAYKPAVKRLAHLANETEHLRDIRNLAMAHEAAEKAQPFQGGLPGSKR